MSKRNAVSNFSYVVQGWQVRIDYKRSGRMQEAEHCACCGSMPVLMQYGEDLKVPGKRLCRLACAKCGTTQPLTEYFEEALQNWNERESYPPIDECPNCGLLFEDPQIITNHADGDWYVKCLNCALSSQLTRTRVAAARAWNTKVRRLERGRASRGKK